jgi:hypothetical protein
MQTNLIVSGHNIVLKNPFCESRYLKKTKYSFPSFLFVLRKILNEAKLQMIYFTLAIIFCVKCYKKTESHQKALISN